MEINFNISNGLGNRPVDRPAANRPVGPVRDQEAFDNLDSLQRQMNTIPVVRPEEVARGQELLSNVHYPPDETIHRLSVLFAMNISSGS